MTDIVTRRNPRKRALGELVSFLSDRLDDDEAAARKLLPRAILQDALSDQDATRSGPVRVLREVAAKRLMLDMWIDRVHADVCHLPVAGPDVADVMIMALVMVYADDPLFKPDWLTDGAERARLRADRPSM